MWMQSPFDMRRLAVLAMCFAAIAFSELKAQNFQNEERGTDASLFWKKTGEKITYVEAQDGDLFNQLGHHGSACYLLQ